MKVILDISEGRYVGYVGKNGTGTFAVLAVLEASVERPNRQQDSSRPNNPTVRKRIEHLPVPQSPKFVFHRVACIHLVNPPAQVRIPQLISMIPFNVPWLVGAA